eukprot:TRINITY_DN76955_c0_g1_i1.p1 TRINITY_DN76955_c0_g1~~TRINITY_DN76955_c0_g1_i1.p1  ORF type:complete len:264 (+),score=18.35 TRINITY_DN76955_c0_g1_i1:62-853(+)
MLLRSQLLKRTPRLCAKAKGGKKEKGGTGGASGGGVAKIAEPPPKEPPQVWDEKPIDPIKLEGGDQMRYPWRVHWSGYSVILWEGRRESAGKMRLSKIWRTSISRNCDVAMPGHGPITRSNPEYYKVSSNWWYEGWVFPESLPVLMRWMYDQEHRFFQKNQFGRGTWGTNTFMRINRDMYEWPLIDAMVESWKEKGLKTDKEILDEAPKEIIQTLDTVLAGVTGGLDQATTTLASTVANATTNPATQVVLAIDHKVKAEEKGA